MNAAELRYHTVQLLNGLSRPAVIGRVELVPAAADEPLTAVAHVVDPYTPGSPERRYRITFEEMD